MVEQRENARDVESLTDNDKLNRGDRQCAQCDEYEYLPPQLSRSVYIYGKEMAPVHLYSIVNT